MWWVAVGGRGSLYGAILVNYGKTVLTGLLPEVWLFTLGAVFIGVTVLMPDGLVGLWKRKNGELNKGEVGHE